jgi:transposase
MDNAAIHKAEHIRSTMKDYGLRGFTNVSYGPEMNAAELFIRAYKGFLKSALALK